MYFLIPQNHTYFLDFTQGEYAHQQIQVGGPELEAPVHNLETPVYNLRTKQ